jgi:hypothetical protein
MRQTLGSFVAVSGALMILAAYPSANHSWSTYHWPSTTGIVGLDVGDSVGSAWDAYLDEALHDWNESVVLQLTKVDGSTNPWRCRPSLGRIEVCTAPYGDNGWLGIAQIWLSGEHILQATAKLNDFYFRMAAYNEPAWRRQVMCQEIAHGFGLDHQDEIFDNANLGTCMDYTDDPDGGLGGAVDDDPSNEHPNTHDLMQLLAIYGHRDPISAAPPGGAAAGNAVDDSPAAWGRLTRSNRNKRIQRFELDLGRGEKQITHVFWADPEGDRRAARDR